MANRDWTIAKNDLVYEIENQMPGTMNCCITELVGED